MIEKNLGLITSLAFYNDFWKVRAVMQTREDIRDDLLSKGLHISESWNYDREDLACIKWLHTGEITPPFINYYRKTVLGLEAVDESRIEEVLKRMETEKKTVKHESWWTNFKSYLGMGVETD